MKRRMNKRFFASLLSLCLLLSLLPTAALADEDNNSSVKTVIDEDLNVGTDETNVELTNEEQESEQEQVPTGSLSETNNQGNELETNQEAAAGADEVTTTDAIIQAIQGGGKVKLESDVTIDSQIIIPENVETDLDLNGHKLIGSYAGVFITNNGTLTINDSSAGGESSGTGAIYTTNTEAQGRVAVKNNGTLTVNGGHFGDADTVMTNQNSVQRGNAIQNYGTATITGGFFTNCDNYTNGGYSYPIVNNEGVMTLEDPTVYGSVNGLLAATGGVLNVNGGTYVLGGEDNANNLFYVVYVSGDGVVNVADGTFTRNNTQDRYFYIDAGSGQINIVGGEFTALGNTKITVGSASDLKDAAGIDISGGTFKGDLNKPENVQVPVSISGGSFTSDVSSFVDPAAIQTGSTGSFEVTARTADSDDTVAQVGDKYYASLQAAINSVGVSGSVTLLASTAESITIHSGTSVELNLNGKTLTNTDGQHTITVELGAVLTVEGDGTVDNVSHGKAAVFNNGTVILNGGSYSRSAENGQSSTSSGGNSYYNIVNHDTMTINEGVTVSQRGGFSSMIENGYYSYSSGNSDTGYVADVNAAAPTLTINGGTFDGGLNTVKNDDNGTLVINDGTFVNNKQAVVLNWNVAEITGGTLDGSSADAAVILNGGGNDSINQGKLTVSGGTFDGGTKPVLAAMNGNTSYLSTEKISVTGGNFSDESVKDFIPENSELVDKNGRYELAPEEGSAAAIGGVGYSSLADAITAAKDGDTVTLLVDVEYGSGIVIDGSAERTITIDFNSHTYTVANDPLAGSPGTKSQCFQLLRGSTITMKNGTIVANNSGVRMIIQNYSNLTLDNMILDATKGINGVSYVLSNNCGNTLITNGTEITAKDGQVAFDVYYWPDNGYAEGVSVTVDNAKINGTIEYGTDGKGTAWESYPEKAKLIITGENTIVNGSFSTYSLKADVPADIEVSGGTFSTEVPSEYCADGFAPTKESDGTYSVVEPTVSLSGSASVRKGNTTALTATVDPDNANVLMSWSSSDSAVATVSDAGVVTGVAAGKATITVEISRTNDTILNSATHEITVTTSSGGSTSGGSSSSSYSITVESGKNGSVSVSPKSASKGTTVTITVKPDSGYELDELVVTDKNDDELKLTAKGDNKYTFTMPASKVSVEASFVKTTDASSGSFQDVSSSAYYYDAVEWAVDKGITSGTSATTFSPNASCTRAQMVTFLWRAAGSPVVNYAMPFTDVDQSAYYADAVRWAVSKGITVGTSATTFSPDATVTRSQTVTFLYRDAGTPGTTGTTPFADVASDAYYDDAVSWAVAEGITAGTSATTFSPNDACTRAQIVTFLYRWMAD